jgi:predicted phosphodiesterase
MASSISFAALERPRRGDRAARIAALYDIHGNLPALDAVLADVRRERVDLIVVGGDVVPGPMPQETMTRLLALDVPVRFIQGNGDRVVLAHLRGEPIDKVPPPYRDMIHWTARALDTNSHDDVDCFTRLTPVDRLARLFNGVDAPLAVCGHTHMQFDRVVGAPFAPPAGAHWLRLGPDVELRQTAYDVTQAARQMRATGYPLVEDTAVRYVLQPPPESEMLAIYARADA